MKEIDVAITDFILAVESLAFAHCISKKPAGRAKHALLIIFLSSGLAAAIGGTFHGFFEPSTRPGDYLWRATLFSVGLTGYGFWRLGVYLVMDEVRQSLADRLAAGALGAYLLAMFFTPRSSRIYSTSTRTRGCCARKPVRNGQSSSPIL